MTRFSACIHILDFCRQVEMPWTSMASEPFLPPLVEPAHMTWAQFTLVKTTLNATLRHSDHAIGVIFEVTLFPSSAISTRAISTQNLSSWLRPMSRNDESLPSHLSPAQQSRYFPIWQRFTWRAKVCGESLSFCIKEEEHERNFEEVGLLIGIWHSVVPAGVAERYKQIVTAFEQAYSAKPMLYARAPGSLIACARILVHSLEVWRVLYED